MAADPTYPLIPLADFVCSASLLLLLTTNFIRQSWNLGVTFLTFWVFWEVLTDGVNAIMWANNADVKHYVYCDIVSRLQLVSAIVKPTCSFIITRRLYKTVVRQSLVALDRTERLIDLSIEWGIGVFLPLIVAGPLYYVVQNARFQVQEGYGCTNSTAISGLQIVLIGFWKILFPLISVFFYSPKIIWTYYWHNKELNRFLRSNGSVSLDRFFRALALASFDILFNLPFGLVNITVTVALYREVYGPSFPFYQGWSAVHADWAVQTASYADERAKGSWALLNYYFPRLSTIVLGFMVFALFGCTEDARATYMRGIRAVGRLFGRAPLRSPREIEPVSFGRRVSVLTWDLDLEGRYVPKLTATDGVSLTRITCSFPSSDTVTITPPIVCSASVKQDSEKDILDACKGHESSTSSQSSQSSLSFHLTRDKCSMDSSA
ncbi:pheromone A receptor-domain-containing protein [Vararia minispora EC-137]|uniref:Pheromone A receptor-domain-containing protein n=1 Tax=Vararia minispora EC-137 TaxID=1314806 RepID=A0ACB8Q726_9AGAM|nr:pheromone A receptor-domain-containing protein [Vararia minispora EC-137]